MATRRIVVRTIPGPGQPENSSQVIGHMVDNGRDDPFGTTPAVQEMMGDDPRGTFDRYYPGYSNGYVEWVKAA